MQINRKFRHFVQINDIYNLVSTFRFDLHIKDIKESVILSFLAEFRIKIRTNKDIIATLPDICPHSTVFSKKDANFQRK